jgi:hypothetical protein
MIMRLMRDDNELRMAETCHPAIVAFLDVLSTDSEVAYQFLNVEALYAWCKSKLGDVFRVVDSWRTFAEQDALPGSVTRARGGQSFHNWGLAVDIIPTRTGYDKVTYTGGRELEMGEFFKECGLVALSKHFGLRWGGDDKGFYDPGHFECGMLPDESLRIEKFAVPGWWTNPNMYTLTSKKSQDGILGGIIGFVREFWGGSLQALGRAIQGEGSGQVLLPAPAGVPASPAGVKSSGTEGMFWYVALGVLIALAWKGNKR